MYYVALVGKSIMKSFKDTFLERETKRRQRRTWIDDFKDWTDIKTSFTLKRTAEGREKWKFMVSNLRTEDGTK